MTSILAYILSIMLIALALMGIVIYLKEGKRGAVIVHVAIILAVGNFLVRVLSMETRSEAEWLLKPLRHIPTDAFTYIAWVAIALFVVGYALRFYEWIAADHDDDKDDEEEKEDEKPGAPRPAGERETKTDQ